MHAAAEDSGCSTDSEEPSVSEGIARAEASADRVPDKPRARPRGPFHSQAKCPS